ncbi:MAG: alpha/beta hydrolase [Motiliproteus sp.]
MISLLLLFLCLVAIVVFVRRGITGEDLSVYDSPKEPLWVDQPASAEHAEVEEQFCRIAPEIAKLPKKQLMLAMRQKMDDWGVRQPVKAQVQPAVGAAVAGDWILAEGADPNKRLLYIHGGAFMLGGPQSHRILTAKLSEISGAAVFAVDYRLCPENRLLDCLDDCQRAYRWLIDHGPQGQAPADQLFVVGDSAGGNISLVLLSWIRDQLLPAPTAAVALSPTVDGTLSSPSIVKNLGTDRMLRPMLEAVVKSPRALLLTATWLVNRVRPIDPRVSPIHGDLSNLPPLLIQASSSECLEDDARRFTNKARAAGSPVKLQLWSNMMHVWQMFEPELDEAKEAFEQIRVFLEQVCAAEKDEGHDEKLQ